jgi:hypothetical protein
MNLPAYRWKFTCTKCHWQSYQETKASAVAIGASHQSQFGNVAPQIASPAETVASASSTDKTKAKDGVTVQTAQSTQVAQTAQTVVK